ncbi:transcription termination factor NusA [Candidatus Jorgensenbacteria bacterium GWA1_49_17]|uniref:Transcription termination/antitermination protein NusA n=1 Tax=Candidatus Jorgensenbacteria bacterium GWA1_49_17 TaxID=1798467 RepID=A0A1F6BT68_9BACT|nr:MAG: transcription termination factor NusA [Candidatus Jorgensenbacteria bacterium GWA1_49_17]
MDLKNVSSAVTQIAEEKGIKPESVFVAIESAIATAYKKEYRKRSEFIRAKLNPKTGDISFYQVKFVVEPAEVRIVTEETEEEKAESRPVAEENETVLPRYNPDRHIFVEEAKEFKKDAKSGDEIEFPLEVHEDFGRIAAQAAKQVILQGLREAERASIHEEFADKEGEIVSGAVERFERGNIYVNLGRAVGIMFHNESIPGEHYRVGARLRFFVLAVQEDPKRPGIVLSRSHPRFVTKLFELEVPEMADGVVEIKAIAREAGSRTKVAVASNEDGIDPVGSAVGQRGTRVMAVTNELGNEKIDVIEWSAEPEKYIANSLSPAKVKLVEALPRREAKVLVAEDQLSLAIGKGGQNVRLAAKLTGWKIDVRSQSRPEEVLSGGVAEVESVGGGDIIENVAEERDEE